MPKTKTKEVPLERQLYQAMLSGIPDWLRDHVRGCYECREYWYALCYHACDDLGIDIEEE